MPATCKSADFRLQQRILEKVAISDALSLKAARRDFIANLKSFKASQHQRQYTPDFVTATKLTRAAKKPNAECVATLMRLAPCTKAGSGAEY